MRLFVKLMLLVVIAALAGPFFIKGPDGKPLWSVQSLKAGVLTTWRRMQNDVEQGLGDAGIDAVSDDVQVFRWQDEDGQWHFSQEAPEGVTAEAMIIDPDTNMISLPALPEPPPPEPASESAGDAPTIQTEVPDGMPDIEETKQLIEDVRNLQDVVNDRERQIREVD
ncbi:MAG: DUF4124 domain-containing protein [Pseudomonadota bacterium]